MKLNKLLMILCLVTCFTVFFNLNLDAKDPKENIDSENLNVKNLYVESINAENSIISTDESSEIDRIFVKIPGLEGDSLDINYNGWIIAYSYSFDITRNWNSDKNKSSSKFGPVDILKSIDRSTPGLAFNTAFGTFFDEVIIECVISYTDAGNVPLYRIKLQGVVIDGISSSISKKEGMFEIVKLSYEKIEWTYFAYDPAGALKGKISYAWNVLKDQPIELSPEVETSTEK
jgi:type VI secretion system secreted protein Hcp